TRRIRATPLPVSIALAGHTNAFDWRNVSAISRTAHARIAARICGTLTRKPRPTCPKTWIVMITVATWRRGSRMFGRMSGYDLAGATISRPQREMLATAVSAANDCFYCMDSHGTFASASLERTGADDLVPLVDVIKVGSSDGFDPKMQALLHIARTVRREPRD